MKIFIFKSMISTWGKTRQKNDGDADDREGGDGDDGDGDDVVRPPLRASSLHRSSARFSLPPTYYTVRLFNYTCNEQCTVYSSVHRHTILYGNTEWDTTNHYNAIKHIITAYGKITPPIYYSAELSHVRRPMSQVHTCDRTSVTGDTFSVICDTCSVTCGHLLEPLWCMLLNMWRFHTGIYCDNII